MKPRYDVIMTCNYSPWSRYTGGGQKSVHMLAGEMARQGLKVAVVYSKAPWENIAPHPTPPYAEHYAGFFALRPTISSPLRFLNGLLFYLKVRSLSSEGTVLHANGDEASLFRLIRKKRAFIYTNRYPEFPGFLSGRNWSRPGAWLAILFREPRFVAIALGIRRADRVAVTSDYSLAAAGKAFGLDPAAMTVVPNGVDPVFLEEAIHPAPGSGVLFFGRLTRAKGADLALDAYALLPAELRSAHPLRILGAGPIRAELQARAAALDIADQVVFPGWKRGAELAREILASAAVCLPSREESFGNSVVEALALGRALVSTRAGSIPEVVGPWGRLAEPEDVKGLAVLLEESLREGMPMADRIAEREFIRSRYSWGRAAERYRELYASLPERDSAIGNGAADGSAPERAQRIGHPVRPE